MTGLLSAITTGIASFAATNIDDILILTLLFSQVNKSFRCRHIVTGQYLGFTALVVASLAGFFGSFIVPSECLQLAGLIPIAIGLFRLVNPEEDSAQDESVSPQSNFSAISGLLSPQTCGVAAITVANGGDNIGIYMPLFANTNLASLLVILSVFFSLVGVWCYAAYRLTRLRAIASLVAEKGNSLVPFVLIGLGVFIVWESFILALLSVAAVYLCLMAVDLVKHRVPST